MTLVDLVVFMMPGAIVGALATSISKDVRLMAGGGTVGAVAGAVMYWLIRISYWKN